MGFGWLFIGYFTVSFLTLNPFGAILRIVGYAIILMATLKLRRYHRAFTWTSFGTGLMLLIAACFGVVKAAEWLYNALIIPSALFSDAVVTGIGYADQWTSLLFHGTLLWAIYQIAKETEVRKIAVNAVRNFVFICLYYALQVLVLLPFSVIQNARGAWVAMTMVVWLVWVILNHVLIASCYAKICDESDQEMEQKPSRFAFVNWFREENERRMQKARTEADNYRKERAERRKRRKK